MVVEVHEHVSLILIESVLFTLKIKRAFGFNNPHAWPSVGYQCFRVVKGSWPSLKPVHKFSCRFLGIPNPYFKQHTHPE